MLQNIFYNKEKKKESVSGTKNWSKRCMKDEEEQSKDTCTLISLFFWEIKYYTIILISFVHKS